MSGDSYVVKPLRADDADGPRNVAFVRQANQVLALKQMFQAVSQGTANAAVWDDTPCFISAGDLDHLAAWCRVHGISVNQQHIRGEAQDKNLRRLFNKIAARDADRALGTQALAPLMAHIKERLKALSQAFPDKDVRLTIDASFLRRKYSTEGGHGLNPHVDKGTGIRSRYIETLAGGATCLIDDRQVIHGGGLDKIVPKDKPLGLWQVRTGALALLTALDNSHKPVMHTAPPDETAFADHGIRIVLIYDVVDKAPSFWDRLKL